MHFISCERRGQRPPPGSVGTPSAPASPALGPRFPTWATNGVRGRVLLRAEEFEFANKQAPRSDSQVASCLSDEE